MKLWQEREGRLYVRKYFKKPRFPSEVSFSHLLRKSYKSGTRARGYLALSSLSRLLPSDKLEKVYKVLSISPFRSAEMNAAVAQLVNKW